MNQEERSYKILAGAQAAVNAAVALGVFALYGLQPGLLNDPLLGLVVAILSVAGVLYYLSFHQMLSKKNLALSTLILTLITGCNLIFVIMATGGLDSPFYAFWLLAIVTAGIFGTADTIAVLGLTAAFYVFALYQHQFSPSYTVGHLPQLLLSLVAGALAEWVYWRTRRMGVQTVKVAKLTGRLTEEQLKAQVLMSAMAEGVMVIDTERRIQLFNPAASTMTGWDEKSAQNIDYHAVLGLTTVTDQPLSDVTDPVTQAWKVGQNYSTSDIIMTTRSGRKLPLYISVSPVFDHEQQITGAIALFRDISKEKEIERQKDEFVSTASHEMRTPVAAIEGYISLVMNPNVATVDDRAMKYLTKAHDAITHLGELFKDLLSATKAEEGKLGGPMMPVNVTELIQTAVEDMQFAVQAKGLTLVFQPAPAAKSINPIFWTIANPERLREVVMNLVDNAIKFTTQGGITITMSGDAKQVTVGVSDTGVGIPTEDQAHLFQKFYRVDNSATRTIGGTGLGLYLCRRVIELFNGRIWIESTFGKGTTISFSLPRITAEEADRQLKEAEHQTLPADSSTDTAPAVEPAPVPVKLTPTPPVTPTVTPTVMTDLKPPTSTPVAAVSVPITTLADHK